MHTQKSPPAEGAGFQDADALRAALEHAQKHAARCDVGAREALDKWTGEERALCWHRLSMAERQEKGAGLDRLWRVYQGERDNARRAHAIVTGVREKLAHVEQRDAEIDRLRAACASRDELARDARERFEVAGSGRVPVSGVALCELERLYGDAQAAADDARANLREALDGREDDEHRAPRSAPAAGESDHRHEHGDGHDMPPNAWQDDINTRTRGAVALATLCNGALSLVMQIGQRARDNGRPPGERLAQIHEHARDAASNLRSLTAALQTATPAAGTNEDTNDDHR